MSWNSVVRRVPCPGLSQLVTASLRLKGTDTRDAATLQRRRQSYTLLESSQNGLKLLGSVP